MRGRICILDRAGEIGGARGRHRRGASDRAQDCWASNGGGAEREKWYHLAFREEGSRLSNEEREWGE